MEYHRLKPLPKMETEISLINTMINVLTYENITATTPNQVVIANAHAIMSRKVNEIYKVINNPTRETQPYKDSELLESE